LAKLKNYKAPPPNGLAIFCGNYQTPTGQKWVNLDIEPLKPITSNLYFCDDKFHVGLLKAQLRDGPRYGVVIINGSGCSIHLIQGSYKVTLEKWAVSLPKKHNRGGQSHDRFRRIREEKRSWYVKDVIAAVTHHLIDPSTNKVNVDGIIVSGYGDLKNDFVKSQHLDGRIKQAILKILDIQYGGESGLNATLELAKDVLSDVQLIRETSILSGLMDTISRDGPYCIGIRETMNALESGVVETLIVWDKLPTIRRSEDGRVRYIDNPTEAENRDDVLVIDWLIDNFLSPITLLSETNLCEA
jgi:peptide chain release factor subunit 1